MTCRLIAAAALLALAGPAAAQGQLTVKVEDAPPPAELSAPVRALLDSAPDAIVITRRGNAGNWINLTGTTPVGDWELGFPDTQAMRNRFRRDAPPNERIDDIVLNVTYTGETPQWPA